MKRNEKTCVSKNVYVPVDEWHQLTEKLKLMGLKGGASEWTRKNLSEYLNENSNQQASKIDTAALAQKLSQIMLEVRKLEDALDDEFKKGHHKHDENHHKQYALNELFEEFGLLDSYENLDAIVAKLLYYKPKQGHCDCFDQADVAIFIRLLHLYKQNNEIKDILKKVGLIKGVAPAENIGGETPEATTVKSMESPEKMDDDPEVLKEVFVKVSSPVIEEQENEEKERKIPDEEEDEE